MRIKFAAPALVTAMFAAGAVLTAPAFAQPVQPSGRAPVQGSTDYRVPEGYTVSDIATVSADELKSVNIYDASDSKVGDISDLTLDANGQMTHLIVDAGGFLGLGSHTVALTPSNLVVYRNAEGKLRGYTALTKDQLKAMPAYEKKS